MRQLDLTPSFTRAIGGGGVVKLRREGGTRGEVPILGFIADGGSRPLDHLEGRGTNGEESLQMKMGSDETAPCPTSLYQSHVPTMAFTFLVEVP